MPIDYSEYPEDWQAISQRIRFERAATPNAPEGRCECEGECGHHHPDNRCLAANYQPHPITGSEVILTVAHWPDHTKANADDSNLTAMCQRCHLSLDADRHHRNRKYGRHHDRAHQLRLFAD